jgi:type IX secretion system PorP/SprF family membrane protein
MAGVLQAQVSPLADQFLLNPFLTNPAFAGTLARAPLNISARQQWLGIKGAPSWQSATWHSSLNAKKQRFNPRGFINRGENAFGNVGVGGGLFNVRYGAISQAGIHVDYAYHVFLGGGRLSFGLAPMYQQFIINKSGFIPPDGNTPDPMIDGDEKEVLHFVDVNAGVHFYTEKLFAGFSAIQILNSAVSFGDLSFPSTGEPFDNPWLARTLYLYGGWTPELSRTVSLEPSVIVRFNDQTGLSIQANVKAIFNENFQAGLLYRLMESAGFFAGITFGDWNVRYLFELPVGTGGFTRFTTHQILLGFLMQ